MSHPRLAALLAVVVQASFACLASGCAAGAETDSTAGAAEDDLTRAECRGPRGETEAACRVEGVVESMFVGEMDPFVVGDACVAFVRSGTRRYGLVREVHDCPDPGRFAAGTIKVSFSKGALTLIAREKSRVLKAYDANAIYYELSGPLREGAADPLAAFDALDDDKKVDALFEIHNEWPSPRADVVEKAIRILDTIPVGDTQRAALAAYTELRDYSFQNGGGKPDVYALQKGGLTYAYAISASGRSYGNWGRYVVYDRSFSELATFGFAD